MGVVFQNSPGVVSREIDLTNSVVAQFSTAGAYAGKFNWGPVDEVFSVSTADELLARVGRPNDYSSEASFLVLSNFLAYSGGVRVVRAGHTVATALESVMLNATSGSAGILVKNDTDFENGAFVPAAGAWVIGRFPGAYGNSLRVVIADSSTFASPGFAAYSRLFDAPPATSDFAVSKGLANANDELHVVVVDELGLWTGVAGTVLESFPFVSRFSDARTPDNEQNYIARVINNRSRYVRIDTSVVAGAALAIPAIGTAAVGSAPSFVFAPIDGDTNVSGADVISLPLTGGVTANEQVDDSDLIDAYSLFVSESVDVSVLIAGEASSVLANYIIQNIAEARQDCMVAISPPRAAVVNNFGNEVTDIIAFRNELPSTSYAVLDSGWKYQYSRFSDSFIWLPLCGDTAGLIAQTDLVSEPWFSPADPDFSTIKNITKLAFNPNKLQRDDLYKASVNPVIDQPGSGTVLFGDKTLLAKNSAFSRINVRKLFIILRKSISTAARQTLFKINDEITQARFRGQITPFLNGVKGRRGVTDFAVVCDERNNTPEVIDNNAFVGDIYVKPTRSINFITLNFVAVPTGIAFSEVVGTV